MKDETIARNYALALVELAERNNEAEAYAAPFRSLAAAFTADPRARRFFASPQVPTEAKRAALVDALQGRAPERFLRFALVVMEKRRQRLFPDIAAAYQALLDERSGEVRVHVTLARQPDQAMESLLAERLSSLVGQPVRPQISVNPAILGGLVVRYGDRLLDGSLRRQLVALRRDMINARLPALPATS